LAALSGVLQFLAFPGMDLWPLAFVAFVPWLYALRGQSRRRAVGMGLVTGFVAASLGFYWLTSMLEEFSGFGTPLCIVFASILNLANAGQFALTSGLYVAMTRKGWHHMPAFLLAFAAAEFSYPVLFPWYYGATVHNAPIFGQTADLGGPILVGVVLMTSNVALAALLRWRLRGAKLERRTLVAAVATLVFAVVYGWIRMSSIEAEMAEAEVVRVGLIQGNNPLKRRKRSTALKTHLSLSAQAKQQNVDLLVWSEGAIPGVWREKGHERDIKRRVTSKLGVPAVVGAILARRLEEPGPTGRRSLYFNSALMADAKGQIIGRYDKQYLLMFGEYLPLGDTFPIMYSWSPHSSRFQPGTSFEPLVWGEHRLGTMICYEDIIPGHVNKLVATGSPDLLVNITNDTWFGDSTEPWIHLRLAQSRSIEHRRYLVRVTNSGVSAIIDPLGRPVIQSKVWDKDFIVGEARYLKSSTVYETIGDIPWWGVSFAAFGLCFVRRPGSPVFVEPKKKNKRRRRKTKKRRRKSKPA